MGFSRTNLIAITVLFFAFVYNNNNNVTGLNRNGLGIFAILFMLQNYEFITISALIHCDFFPLLYKSAVPELFREIHYLFSMVSYPKCNIVFLQNLEYLMVLVIIKLCKLLAFWLPIEYILAFSYLLV